VCWGIRCILAIYTGWWPDRHGSETAELTEDRLGQPGARRLQVVTNLLVGSVVAWAHLRGRTQLPMAFTGP
jgi:hypothetical protein